MTQDYWIKIKENSEHLLDADPDAYLIMSKIMFECRRLSKNKYLRKNLEIGQALITPPKSVSNQRWKDAKTRIEFEHKLATFKGTNKGTIATLINTEFCDINFKSENQQENHPRTNKEPTENQPALGSFDRIKKEEDRSIPSSINNRDFSLDFSESWLDHVEKEEGIKLHGTEIDKIVRKYQIPERDIRLWRQNYSCDFIAGTILMLEAQNPNMLFSQFVELTATNSDPIIYVMLCKSQIVPLINTALEQNYLTKAKKKKDKKPPSEGALVLAKKLEEAIRTYHPTLKKPNLEAWSRHIDLMMSPDGREHDEILEVIQWLPSSDFWKSTIINTEKLRKHFDTLSIKMKEPGNKIKQESKNASRAYSGGQRLTEYDNL